MFPSTHLSTIVTAVILLLECAGCSKTHYFTSFNGIRRSFNPGTIKQCRALKKQQNPKLDDIARMMNNSWVRIMNRSRNDRGQIPVESLEYPNVCMAVPRRKRGP